MYASQDRLVIVDADGTLVDAFEAMETTFARHGMDLGDLDRFQKRRHLFKYLGGLREFPGNLARNLRKGMRRTLLGTLTEVYREEARLYPGMADLLRDLIDVPDVRVGMVTRNVTHEPDITLTRLFARHDVDLGRCDFLHHIPLGETKAACFKAVRERLAVHPARGYACGDEHKDYAAALAAGLYPMIVSYGFESHARLTGRFAIPEENLSRTPQAFAASLRQALDLSTQMTVTDRPSMLKSAQPGH